MVININNNYNATCTTIIIIIQIDTTLSGIDWNGPIPVTEDDQVTVADTLNPLQDADFLQLQATISPIDNSDCHGVDIFLRCLQFVCQKINNYT